MLKATHTKNKKEKEREDKQMYYVLDRETEETLCMTRREDIAQMVADLAEAPAIIRKGEK